MLRDTLLPPVRRALVVAGVVLLAGLVAPSQALAQGTGADVAVTKSAPIGTYSMNSVVPYTITVESNGPATATSVQLVDSLPATLTFVSIEAPAGWLCITPAPGGGGTISCTASALNPGTTATFTVNLRVAAGVLPGTQVVNTATVSSAAPDPQPSNNSSTWSFIAAGGSRDTAGVYDPSTAAWFLRNTNSAGTADLLFTYGPGGAFVPIKGDWNSDGVDTPGVYDPSTGAFFLKNSNAPGGADIVFTFGAGGVGYVPLAGDWNGDGFDSIGLYQPATGVFFLRNSNTNGPADVIFSFGAGGLGYVPLAGDWNGNGVDTIGLYQPATGAFFLRNSNSNGGADLVFTFGAANSVPLAGDWDGDGLGADSIGIYIPVTGAWFLKNTNAPGQADLVFVYGPPNFTPIPGDWNGL